MKEVHYLILTLELESSSVELFVDLHQSSGYHIQSTLSLQDLHNKVSKNIKRRTLHRTLI